MNRISDFIGSLIGFAILFFALCCGVGLIKLSVGILRWVFIGTLIF